MPMGAFYRLLQMAATVLESEISGVAIVYVVPLGLQDKFSMTASLVSGANLLERTPVGATSTPWSPREH